MTASISAMLGRRGLSLTSPQDGLKGMSWASNREVEEFALEIPVFKDKDSIH